MIRIRLYAHPLRPDVQVFHVGNVGEWLLDHFGPAPEVRVQVFAGEPSAETEITGDVAALVLSDQAEYVVLQSPAGPYLLPLQIFLTVLSVAKALAGPDETMPNNVNRTQASPNNSLGERNNQVRIGQRVEDIFGTVNAVPSLMMPTYFKYLNHEKYEYGYYCISRGYIDAAEVSDGDSLIADITGASAAIYWPFTSPNSGDAPVLQIGAAIIDPILTVSRSEQIDGVTLKALNQLQFTAGERYTFTPDAGGDIITQRRKAPNVNSLINPGDEITLAMADYVVTGAGATSADSAGSYFSVAAPAPGADTAGDIDPVEQLRAGDVVAIVCAVEASNSGTYTVTSVAARLIHVTPAPPTDSINDDTTFTVTRNYTGTYTVDGVADGFIVLTTSTFVSAVPPTELLPGAPADLAVVTDIPVTEYTDWVTLPDPARTEVWVNIVAPNGLVKDDGGQSSVTVLFDVEIERLDPNTLAPTGTVEVVNASLMGSVTNERADTVEHATAWTGPARVRMRRTSDHDFDFQGQVVDEIKWQDLYSVVPVTKTDFGNKTTAHTITRATARSTAIKTRQLNCVASRLIPTFDGSTLSATFDAAGRHISGTLHATSKVVDIMAAVSLDPKIGARDLATDVDMAQIWGVQQQIDAWNTDCGEFNYTLDSDGMSYEETVIAIANAAFCTAYRQNGKIRFAYDRAQASSTAIFTHRNKKPNAETLSRRFASDSDYDGVEFVYVDPDSNQSETITLPAAGAYAKLKKFEIPGIRHFSQAWFRANREFYKLRGQRISIETATTNDARALLPNARIDIVDNTRFKSYDGEVVRQSGLTLTLSRNVEFTPGQPHSVVLMRRDGSVQSIVVAPGPEANQVVLATAPGEAIVTTGGAAGIRTIFSFASDSTRKAMAWLVTEVDLADPQYPTVRAVNYSADYYRQDSLPVPAKASIIN